MKHYLQKFFGSLIAISLSTILFLANVSIFPGIYADARLEAQENVNVDVLSSAQRSRAGYQAFAKKDYLLAKQECEAALDLNPENLAAQKLSKEITGKLESLDKLIGEIAASFKPGQENRVELNWVHDVMSDCINYPAAEPLYRQAAQILTAQSLDSYGRGDLEDALKKAREALEFVPNDSDALDLIKMYNDDLFESFMQETPGSRATLTYKGVEFAFRYCPPGTFTMGSPSTEKGRKSNEKQRSVKISDGFWISETETTWGQWSAVWNEKRGNTKSPVVEVLWSDCNSFCRKLNNLNVAPEGWYFTLPTEEQWEYACRAGTTGSTYGVPLNECCPKDYFDCDYQVGNTEPNKWGIYEMLGGVLEWTNSPSEESEFVIICRGGFDEEEEMRPAWRKGYVVDNDNSKGCRIILVPRRSK